MGKISHLKHFLVVMLLSCRLQDKWLCPLSGKKFKGPDFVKKHIMQKHVEKVEEVKKEVNFFNNYLRVSPVLLLISMDDYC